jgi:DNA-binding transcriptional ArsR family regulator
MAKPSTLTSALRASAHKACGLLNALAHEDRLLLLCQLAHEERSVGELEEMLDIRQPSLSQHLGVLRRQKLVTTRRDGKRIYYRLASEDARAVLDTLYNRFCGNEKSR